MSRPAADALSFSLKVVRALRYLNRLAGVLIGALLIAALVAKTPVFTALGVRPLEGKGALIMGMYAIMVVGIIATVLVNVVLVRLEAIVVTVQGGDPFVSENAERLRSIAWAVLGLEATHVVIGAIAAAVSTEAPSLDIRWTFNLTRWLTVLMLFVLARVFEHGTRMREDLEGVV